MLQVRTQNIIAEKRQRQTETIKLNDDERKIFENRCPRGYKKLRILGKGGCAVVWLCQSEVTGEEVAAKQFPRNHHSFKDAQNEVTINNLIKES